MGDAAGRPIILWNSRHRGAPDITDGDCAWPIVTSATIVGDALLLDCVAGACPGRHCSIWTTFLSGLIHRIITMFTPPCECANHHFASALRHVKARSNSEWAFSWNTPGTSMIKVLIPANHVKVMPRPGIRPFLVQSFELDWDDRTESDMLALTSIFHLLLQGSNPRLQVPHADEPDWRHSLVSASSSDGRTEDIGKDDASGAWKSAFSLHCEPILN